MSYNSSNTAPLGRETMSYFRSLINAKNSTQINAQNAQKNKQTSEKIGEYLSFVNKQKTTKCVIKRDLLRDKANVEITGETNTTYNNNRYNPNCVMDEIVL